MSADLAFRSRPGRLLLWLMGLLAMAWLAAIAWQAPSAERTGPITTAPVPAEPPTRPAFEDMVTAISENRALALTQWQSWQDLNARALKAAQSAGHPGHALKDAEANLQLLSRELSTQVEAARNTPQLIWLMLRLSRANPQLRLFEQERVELERAPADLSRLLLRLFAVSLPNESLEPNWAAYEASCPVWGELSQAVGQLQKDVETPRGRRSDLARRSLSTLEQPALIASIHAQASQCTALIESRKAVATLAKALAQVPWSEVFATPAAAPLAAASVPGSAAPAGGPVGAGLLATRWVPVALCLGLICLLTLGLTSRVRQREIREAYNDLQEQKQRLQRQVDQLRATAAAQGPALLAHQTEPTASAFGPKEIQASPASATSEPLRGSLNPVAEASSPAPLSPRPETRVADIPSGWQAPSNARIERAQERLRSAQFGLIEGRSPEDVLRDLDHAQALLDHAAQDGKDRHEP
jgi:hypothetical protein